MYVDDEIALTVRDMAIAKADAEIAQKQYETSRDEVVAWMKAHDTKFLTTDEYAVTLSDRSTIRIDRKELEAREPDLFKEIATVSINTIVKITPR